MRTKARVYALPVVLIIAGGGLALWATQMPRYHDPNWADRFIGVEATLENSDALSEEWYAAQEKGLTSRDRLFDLGLGVATLGLSIVSLLVILRVENVLDLQALMTPRTKRTWYITAVVGWVSFVPAVWAYLFYAYKRGDYPWWADSIAIPAAGAAITGFWGVVIVLWAVYLSTRRATLPARLWSRPILGGAWFVGTGALLAVVLFLVLLVNGVLANFFTVPSSIAMLYISLCCRAASATTGRITTPFSGRTRASRPVLEERTGRAARRAADGER
jgi:hypothetical protein